jgi:hypothetical protein
MPAWPGSVGHVVARTLEASLKVAGELESLFQDISVP